MSFAALGGPSGAPGHTLTPEVLWPKQFLHLLPSDLYAGLPHDQTWEKEHKGFFFKSRRRETVNRTKNKELTVQENDINLNTRKYKQMDS